jgi:hypothetical protein
MAPDRSSTPAEQSLVGWMTAVEDYWAKDGTLCGNCDFNDPDRGCDFLYAPSIPQGECVGIQRKLGMKQPEFK